MVTMLYLTRLRTLCWRMKKAVLDYRYGHSALFDQTEDFVLAQEEGSAGLQVWSLCSI